MEKIQEGRNQEYERTRTGGDWEDSGFNSVL